MNKTFERIIECCKPAFPKAGKTIWWLLRIILPVSLLVSFLQHWGVIAQLASLLTPVFSHIGLPGESAIVFISSIFLPLYAPIAIISTLSLGMREITILALMCLISHNMIVETAIQKKTGSSATLIFLTRIVASFIAAYLLNLVLPEMPEPAHKAVKHLVAADSTTILINWIINSGSLALKISLIITALMLLQNILKEFKVLNLLSRTFAPLMRIMGLSDKSSFLWLIAQTLGLTYGSAVLIEEVENQEVSKEEANFLNYHIAINHSLLEDTLLFVAIGVPAGWLIAPRFLLAMLLVWCMQIFKRHLAKN